MRRRSEIPSRDVVMYSSSSSAPPKAQLVTWLQGSSTTVSRRPVGVVAVDGLPPTARPRGSPRHRWSCRRAGRASPATSMAGGEPDLPVAGSASKASTRPVGGVDVVHRRCVRRPGQPVGDRDLRQHLVDRVRRDRAGTATRRRAVRRMPSNPPRSGPPGRICRRSSGSAGRCSGWGIAKRRRSSPSGSWSHRPSPSASARPPPDRGTATHTGWSYFVTASEPSGVVR